MYGDAVAALLQFLHFVQHRGLHSTEGKIPGSIEPGTGEVEARSITLLRGFLDGGSAGIRQVQQPRHLIKGFTCRIIQRRAEALIGKMIGHQIQLGVTARNKQSHKRELRRRRNILARFIHPCRIDVTLKMIHADNGFVESKRDTLCHVHADDQRTSETGSLCDSDGINVIEREMRLRECLLYNRDNTQHMLARRDFRKDATITGMDFHLRSHNGREQCTSIFDDSAGGFIAGGFNGKNSGRF